MSMANEMGGVDPRTGLAPIPMGQLQSAWGQPPPAGLPLLPIPDNFSAAAPPPTGLVPAAPTQFTPPSVTFQPPATYPPAAQPQFADPYAFQAPVLAADGFQQPPAPQAAYPGTDTYGLQVAASPFPVAPAYPAQAPGPVQAVPPSDPAQQQKAPDLQERESKAQRKKLLQIIAGAALGFLAVFGLTLLLGGLALLPVAVMLGTIAGVYAGMAAPQLLGCEHGDNTATEAAARRVMPATSQPPGSTPYLQQVDETLQRAQQVRDRQEAEDIHRRLSEHLMSLQTAMQQALAANDRHYYGEFSRRYVLVSQAREGIQARLQLAR